MSTSEILERDWLFLLKYLSLSAQIHAGRGAVCGGGWGIREDVPALGWLPVRHCIAPITLRLMNSWKGFARDDGTNRFCRIGD